MATYEEIYGKRVKDFDSDPTLDSSYEGQVWYNSATGTLKTVVQFGAWASVPSLITNHGSAAGTGTNTAGLIFGGNTGPGGPKSNATEEWNGTGFSTGGNLPFSRAEMGAGGPQTAAVGFGGFTAPPPPGATATVEYDGSSWTSGGAMSAGRTNLGSSGIQTAALAFGGAEAASPNPSNRTEEYDGSSWTAGGNLGTARYQLMGNNVGTQTDGVCVGGYASPGAQSIVENYDGSSWTAGTALPTAGGNQARNGLSNTIMVAGGTPGPNDGTKCYTFNGTAWSEIDSLASARSSNAGAGDSGGSIIAGASPYAKTTEEYNFGINTITTAAWSSGGNLNTGRELGGNAGTSTAGLLMAGKVYPNTFKGETEEYNGTSWSEQSDASTARATAGAGTQTAGIIFGGTNGAPGSTGVQTATEEYDGSSWTNGGALSTARMGLYGAGLQTACFGAGGTNSSNSPVTTVEDYNGTSWTAGTAIPTAQQGGGGAGLPSARLVFAGYAPYASFTVEGDGEGWTAGGNMIDARGQLAGFGSQTDALACAGSTSPPNVDTTAVEGYDGTSWSTRPSLSTERMGLSPGGSYNTTTGGMVVGGSDSGNPMRNQTEEWSAATGTVTASTLTTS